MALFKIFKGNESQLQTGKPYAQEGFCYFCQDTGKFYIDTAGETGNTTTTAVIGVNRIPINTPYADLSAVSGRIPFGTCSTTASTATKEINTNGLVHELEINNTTLYPKSGTMLMVYFATANSATNATFKIPGVGSEQGTAIAIYYSGSQIDNSAFCSWNAGSLRLFIFMTDDDTNGTNPRWIMLDNNKYAESVKNNFILKIKSGTTEGTDLYTFNGSAAKTLDIQQGSGITLTPAANSLTIAANINSVDTLTTPRTIDGISFDGSADIAHYGECNTAANVAAKTVTMTGFVLAKGARLSVKFTSMNTAVNPTLNINNTGDKAIYYRTFRITERQLRGQTYTFVYDGTSYQVISPIGEEMAILPSGNDQGVNVPIYFKLDQPLVTSGSHTRFYGVYRGNRYNKTFSYIPFSFMYYTTDQLFHAYYDDPQKTLTSFSIIVTEDKTIYLKVVDDSLLTLHSIYVVRSIYPYFNVVSNFTHTDPTGENPFNVTNFTNISAKTLTIGSYTFDGTANVTIPIYDGAYTVA